MNLKINMSKELAFIYGKAKLVERVKKTGTNGFSGKGIILPTSNFWCGPSNFGPTMI